MKLITRENTIEGALLPDAWIAHGNVGSGDKKYLLVSIPSFQYKVYRDWWHQDREMIGWWIPWVAITWTRRFGKLKFEFYHNERMHGPQEII